MNDDSHKIKINNNDDLAIFIRTELCYSNDSNSNNNKKNKRSTNNNSTTNT